MCKIRLKMRDYAFMQIKFDSPCPATVLAILKYFYLSISTLNTFFKYLVFILNTFVSTLLEYLSTHGKF